MIKLTSLKDEVPNEIPTDDETVVRLLPSTAKRYHQVTINEKYIMGYWWDDVREHTQLIMSNGGAFLILETPDRIDVVLHG